MRWLFSFFLPIGWILKIFWKLLKKYGWLVVIVLYLFRGTLFSKPLARILEEKINQKTGMEIKIGRVTGTYFTSFSLSDVELTKPHQSLHQLRCKEIGVSYNLLAPIFGERILQEVHIYNPEVVIGPSTATPEDVLETMLSTPQNSKNPTPSNTNMLEGIDWQILMQNGPNIDIRSANLEIDKQDRFLKVSQFNLKTSPYEGKIAWDQFLFKDKNKTRYLENLGVDWQYDNGVVRITKAQINVPGYPEPLTFSRVIEFDLRQQRISLEKFEIPLPGGGILAGKMDTTAGCFLRLDHSEVAIQELDPVWDMLDTKVVKMPGYLHFCLVINWPEWDIAKFQGQLGVAITHDTKPVTWHFDNVDSGLNTELILDDLGLINVVAKQLGLELPKLAGSVSIRQTMNIEPQQKFSTTGQFTSQNLYTPYAETPNLNIQWNAESNWNRSQMNSVGTLKSQGLSTAYSAPSDLGIQWKIRSNLEKAEVWIDRLAVEFLQSYVEMQGKINQSPNLLSADVQGQAKTSQLQKLLPQYNIAGAMATKWQLNTKWPAQAKNFNTLPEQITGTHTLEFPELTVARRTLRDIDLGYQFSITPQSCDIQNFQLAVGKSPSQLLHMKGYANISKVSTTKPGPSTKPPGPSTKPPSPSPATNLQPAWQGKCQLEGKIYDLKSFTRQLAIPNLDCQGQLAWNIELHSAQFRSEQDWDVKGQFSFTLSNAKIRLPQTMQEFTCRQLTIFVCFDINPRQLTLSSWKIQLDDLAIAQGNLVITDYLQTITALTTPPGSSNPVPITLTPPMPGSSSQSTVKLTCQWNCLRIQDMLTKLRLPNPQDLQGALSGRAVITTNLIPLVQNDWQNVNLQLDTTAAWKQAKMLKIALPTLQTTAKINIQNNNLSIPNWQVWCGQEHILTCKANYTSAGIAETQGYLKFAKIETYLALCKKITTAYQAEIPLQATGALLFSWQLRARLPNLATIAKMFAPSPGQPLMNPPGQPLDMLEIIQSTAGKMECKLTNGNFQVLDLPGYTFENIQFRTQFQSQKKKFNITDIVLTYDDRLDVQGRANLDLTPRSQSDWKMQVKIPLLAKWQEIIRLPPQITIQNIALFVEGQGKIIEKQLENNLRLELKEVQVAQQKFPRLDLIFAGTATPGVLTIKNFQLQEPEYWLARCNGVVYYDGSQASQLQFQMNTDRGVQLSQESIIPKIQWQTQSNFSGQISGIIHAQKKQADLNIDYNFELLPQAGKKQWTIQGFDVEITGLDNYHSFGTPPPMPSFTAYSAQNPSASNPQTTTPLPSAGPALSGTPATTPLPSAGPTLSEPTIFAPIALPSMPTSNKAGFIGKVHVQYSADTPPQIAGWVQYFLPKIAMQDFMIRDLQGNIQIPELQNLVALELNALFGGSWIQCQAQLSHQNYRPQNFALRVHGERVLAIRTQELYGRANMDLLLAGNIQPSSNTTATDPKSSAQNISNTTASDPKSPAPNISNTTASDSKSPAPPYHIQAKLSGKIEFVELTMQSNISLQSAPERVQMYPGWEFPGLDLELALELLFPQIRTKNNLLDITTQGKLDITGNLARPLIHGFFQTKSGKLFLPQGLMMIRECLIRFQPEYPLLPTIYIKAETNVRDYRIQVLIQGRWPEINMDFISLPPLSQEDILMLLMTGATREELQGAPSEKLKETGSFILMQQFLNSVGLGDYVSAQVTEESATITVTPPSWGGFAVQGKVTKVGGMRLRMIYRIEYK